MNVVGFVPCKLNSERLPRKNILPLGGRPLINYALATLAASAVDDTVIYSSSDEIMASVEPGVPCRHLLRPAELDSDDARVQDFVGGFLRDVDADVVVLLHITSPFFRPHTVDACIEAVRSGRCDSAFAAIEARRFAWFDGQPLNYDPDQPTPRTQDLTPVLFEQSGLYVFTRELFERTGSRIGDEPHIEIVDEFEGHDIDTALEFEIAEAMLALRRPTSPTQAPPSDLI